MTKPVLGFCGIGLMGAPMARRLLQAGYRVQIWNRSLEKAQALQDAGAEIAASPAALAQTCQTIFLCLTDENAVEATVFGDQGIHRAPGALLVDHSSISPTATKDFAARLFKASGHAWVDAPVSGGAASANAGTLTIMAGGPADAVARATPLMQAYAAQITHMGDTGAGQVAKLCNQTIVAASINAIAEAVALAQHNGIDAAGLSTALAGGWADSTLLQIFVPRMVTQVNQPLGSVATMLKDLNNVAALADGTGTSLRVLTAVRQSFQLAVEQGLAQADLSEIVRVPWPEKPTTTTETL
ncbi:NAD(P)-dependent oxidoreductase [Alcaligenaceae bacterium]|nr:NAD(P)-dependent oxidoreductase [Alcaligenaceae bacterium]